MSQLITIDTSKVPILKEEGGKLVVNVKAEESIVKLRELQEALDEATAYVKAEIERQGLEFSKDFSSVEGDLVKANYQAFGTKYGVDDYSVLHTLPEELVIKEIVPETAVHKLAPATVIDKYLKENEGVFPPGLKVLPRKKVIVLKFKDKK